MNIAGYAYSTEETSEQHRRQTRMAVLNEQNFKQYVGISSSQVMYAKHKYVGTVDPSCPIEFTPEDLLIWLDGRPMAPFGGTIDYDKSSGNFSATVYTD